MISIVVPVFNEESALPYFFKELLSVTESMSDHPFEFLFVNDGSLDNSLQIIKGLAEKDKRVKYVSFSRNFGKEAAIYAGLKYSKGDFVAIMDADLQDPPSLLPEMLKETIDGKYDSVATRRVNRKGEPPIRSFFARRFYKLMNKISDTELVDGARDYRFMNRKFVDAILSMGEYNRFSKGLFGWVGFKTKWLEFENRARIAGESRWSFGKLLLYAADGIAAFSTTPLVISAITGIILSLLAFISLVFIVTRRLIFGDAVQGWASMICVMLFLGGIQLLFMGVLGHYMAKTYLETKKRPIFIPDETNINN